MPAFKTIAFLAIAVVAYTHALDEEQDRAKKDAPGMMMMMTSQDDGSWSLGKYDKAPVMPYHSVMQYAMPSYHPMMPYHGVPAYQGVPAYHGMTAYPYAYSHMPITKVY